MPQQLTAYRWKEVLFCEGDVVDALLDESPWSAWLDENERPDDNATAEEVLDQIARYFSINRNSKREVDAMSFPIRLRGTPEPPQFCHSCLRWFS